MYLHNDRFMDVVSEYIDFFENGELKQEVKKVMGIGQITFDSGIQTGIRTGIEAFVLDNEEEGIPKERVIEKF